MEPRRLVFLNSETSTMMRRNCYYRQGWGHAKRELESKCIPENWGYDSSILHNYVNQLFAAVAKRYLERDGSNNNDYYEGVFISDNDQFMCFHTGLVTTNFDTIFGKFERNRAVAMQPWVFKGWLTEYELRRERIFRLMPERFVFFQQFHELYYNPAISITIYTTHILSEDESHGRLHMLFPEADNTMLLTYLDGAISKMKSRVSQNSRTVVPQFFNGRIQLLLPLSFTADRTVSLVIPVEKSEVPLRAGEERDPRNPAHWQYLGATVLTVEMAYNNARLLNSLESEWLVPFNFHPHI